MDSAIDTIDTAGAVGTADQGLRARKKRATRAAIERTLLELVLERGYAAATVDEVCARVGVSKKTFFNYYASKEAAVRGDVMAFPTADQVRAALAGKPAGEGYLETVVSLLGLDEGHPGGDPELARLRSEVLATMPQLLYQGHRELARAQKTICETLADYLENHPAERLMSDVPVGEEAVVAASTAVSAIRIRSVIAARRREPVDVAEVRRLIAACVAGDAGRNAPLPPRPSAPGRDSGPVPMPRL